MSFYSTTRNNKNGWCWPMDGGIPIELQLVFLSLQQSLLNLAEALSSLAPSLLWKRPSADIPSIGNLLMHLRGTEHQWIGHHVGGLPLKRNRDAEFGTEEGQSLIELMRELHAVREESASVLRRFDTATIAGFRDIENRSLLFDLHYVNQHYAYHVGQVVLLRKLFQGEFAMYVPPRSP